MWLSRTGVLGPTRDSRARADADLSAMRAAPSRDDVSRIVRELIVSAIAVSPSVAEGGVTGDSVIATCPSAGDDALSAPGSAAASGPASSSDYGAIDEASGARARSARDGTMAHVRRCVLEQLGLLKDWLEMHQWRTPLRQSDKCEERRVANILRKMRIRASMPLGRGSKPSDRQLNAAEVDELNQVLNRLKPAWPDLGEGAQVDAAAPNAEPDRDATAGAGVGSVVTLALPGLNVQWPFSQLMLAGAKTCETRGYALGHRNIAWAGVEHWIVETRGPTAVASKNAVIGDAVVGARPVKTQIVGTVVFSASVPYADRHTFCLDAAAHRINAGGVYDWRGNGEMQAWRVASVRRLAHPVLVGTTGQTGFGPRSFDVIFLGGSQSLRADAPPMAIATPAGGAALFGGDAARSGDVDGIGARRPACPSRSHSRIRGRRRSRSSRAARAAVTPDARRSPPTPTTPAEALRQARCGASLMGHGRQT